ncbi:Translation machinery-associated protein 22 [Porphyridium purpureum]|uniref:Translation machinery-associated protein 22 n=1 Tax=Porphyridium purpureum TaxID=35688 RepID=A0A5J4Z684_PORPP|nr:Translation machinery-associated protein 22 [Porphyridium purpureum]|eukprot:POR1882..scf295_1
MSDLSDIESLDGGSAAHSDVEEQGAVDDGTAAVSYPLHVVYCGNCGLPPEYCEFDAKEFEARCKPWIASNCPWVYPDLFPKGSGGAVEENMKQLDIQDADGEEPKEKPGKKKKGDPEVLLALSTKKGRKSATVITGADLFGIKLDEAAKMFKKRFACGCAVTKNAQQQDTIEVQGDQRREAAELLRDQYNVPEYVIFIMEDKKSKVRAFP